MSYLLQPVVRLVRSRFSAPPPLTRRRRPVALLALAGDRRHPCGDTQPSADHLWRRLRPGAQGDDRVAREGRSFRVGRRLQGAHRRCGSPRNAPRPTPIRRSPLHTLMAAAHMRVLLTATTTRVLLTATTTLAHSYPKVGSSRMINAAAAGLRHTKPCVTHDRAAHHPARYVAPLAATCLCRSASGRRPHTCLRSLPLIPFLCLLRDRALAPACSRELAPAAPSAAGARLWRGGGGPAARRRRQRRVGCRAGCALCSRNREGLRCWRRAPRST